MEGNSFYEPTQQLDIVKNLINGRFSVLLLPTKLPEVQCWQIFAYNKVTEQIESLNIERSKDGLFNLQGMPTTSTTGAAKSGLKFNGNGYVELPNVVNSDSGTLEFWVKFASLEDQILVDASTTFDPIGNADPILNVKYFYLAIANQKLRFGFEDATDKDFVLNAEQPVPSTRYWHHVAVSWNYKTSAGTAIAQLYLNGQLVGQLKDDKLAGPKPTLSSLFFGKIRPADNKGQPEHKSTAPFKGKIDEIRCWSVARTEADLSASLHRRLQGTEPGLVGYWRCDDGAGTRVTDRALHSELANANHGSIHGAVAWTWSDAPIETTEVSQTGFKIGNCTIASGISALLYYQQEEGSTGYDNEPKPLKKNARVMLTVGARRVGEGIIEVAAIDFGVSRNGKLAELPSVIELPSIASGEQPMPLQTIDSTGLSVSGAILRFAQFRGSRLNSIESAPLLFESANGRIALYFAAQDEKFSVAYYDPLTAKANYSLDASSVVPVGKLARSLSGTVAQFSLVRSGDAVRRSISAGATLKLATTAVTVKERVAKDATTVAIEPIQLTNSIPEGTAISLVEAGSITMVARTAGSLLDSATIVVGNGSTPTTCTITLESTALGIKEVWQDVPRHAEKFVRVLNGAASTDETDPYYYDYANMDVVEGPNSNPALGSLLFVAVNDRPQGEVGNTPAARLVTDPPTRSARWIADVPGQAMQFDGQDDYLAIAASSFKKLNSDNDLTLEAWIKPTNIDKTASVIHYHHDSDYTL
ncbi:LamG domain-containing protein, partial [Leptolyngbya sp. FACHB-36]|uniref:LamG domain-containing protein n=1 Tax=Leptolyngbya sp. FACHB-36 TaxID=2692808 RepID=UPI001680A90F